MATIELRMKMVHGDIQAILNRAKQKDAPVVRLRDLAFALLRKNKLSYKARFHCRQVGFNPRNRAQVGIEPQENTRRLRKYRRSGWSNIECSNAAATERAPGARGDAIEKKNIEVVEQSAGKIASVLPGSLKIFTITCGHTNQALRAGDAELPSTEEDLSLNGKLNKVKICGDDQDYLEAMTIGMEWTVIPWQIEQKYPELIDLIIEADNVPVTAARADNIVERLFKIQKIAKEASLSGNTDWNLIANIANRSELQRPEEEVAQLVSFVKSSSGGLENPFVLREIDNWAKTSPFYARLPPECAGPVREPRPWSRRGRLLAGCLCQANVVERRPIHHIEKREQVFLDARYQQHGQDYQAYGFTGQRDDGESPNRDVEGR